MADRNFKDLVGYGYHPDEKCRGDRFCRGRCCKPSLVGGPSGNLLSCFARSLASRLRPSGFDQAQGGGR
jgi:hypothetical protein